MDNIVNNSKKPVVTQEHKILFKNTFYSYLNNYGSYIFSLVTSFILARLISQDLWGYLILSLSYITIIGIIISFLPPGLNHSLIYYISRYRAQTEKSKIKSMIKNAIIIKLLFLLPIFIISIIFFYFFSTFLEINLKEHTNLLFIFSPLILVNALNPTLNSINQAFDRFRLLFFLLVLRYSFNIGSLIYLIINIKVINIETIAFIDLFSFLIPFIGNCFLIMIYYLKMKNPMEDKLTIRESLSQSLSYGGYITLGSVINGFWNELSVQSIGMRETPRWVTGYKISYNYNSVPRFSVTSFTGPLTISFSRLYSNVNLESINKIFILTFHYTMFFFSLFTGIFYFLGEFFLSFVYGESYLIFLIILQAILISSIFTVLGAQFESLIYASNKVKFLPKLLLIIYIIKAPLFFVGLIYFGLLGAIIGLLINSILNFLIRIVLCFKIFNIKIDIKRILKQYLTFFISLAFIIILNYIFLDNLNIIIFQGLNLSILKNLKLIAVSLYILVFLILNVIFKIFSKKDIEYLEAIFEKDKKVFLMVKKGLNLFKRYLS